MSYFSKYKVRNAIESVAPELSQEWGSRCLFDALADEVLSGKKELMVAVREAQDLEREHLDNKRGVRTRDLVEDVAFGVAVAALLDRPRRATIGERIDFVDAMRHRRRFGR